MPTNTDPLAVDDSATVAAAIGATLTTAAPGVLANDSDPAGNPLSVTDFASVSSGTTGIASSSVTGAYGSLVLNSDGSYNYSVTNVIGPTGTHLLDAFTYTVSDGQGGTASAELDITLNRGPVAANDAAGVGIGGTVTGNVLTNDSDPDGDTIQLTAVAGGTLGQAVNGHYGELVLNADGSYEYTADRHAHLPRNGVVQDTFTYTESDSLGGTTQATLTISITQKGQTGTLGTAGQTLNGTNGKDLLDGSLGSQTLFGKNGADGLIGGPSDVLTGGRGPDTFVFKGDFGHNEITDYKYPDRIQLDKSAWGTVDNVLSHAVNDGLGNVIITDPTNSANVIQLDHVSVSQLQNHDFFFV